jgi:hypothetical protein
MARSTPLAPSRDWRRHNLHAVEIAVRRDHRVAEIDVVELFATLVGFHNAARLADLVETEDPHGLNVEPTGCGVRGDQSKRHVREPKARSTEHEAAEEGQIDAARRLQQRVEVVGRIETAKPGAGTAAKRSEGAEHDAVAIFIRELGSGMRPFRLWLTWIDCWERA